MNAAGLTEAVVIAGEHNLEGMLDLTRSIHFIKTCVVLQEASTATAATRTGLEHTRQDESVLIACSNDVVPDGAHSRLLTVDQDVDLALLTTKLAWRFVGGRLDVDDSRRGPTLRVNAIREERTVGCAPGSWVNIFIHRISPPLKDVLLRKLRTLDYESAVNMSLALGFHGEALITEKWVGIKSARDIERVKECFGLTVS